MNGFGFETFQVVEGNRGAYEASREVAELECPGGTLTVLLGPEQAGKSHLLWSIARRVRGGSTRVGLALIMAREFPQKVRDLLRDPSPITGGRRAILLVDQLDRFRENVSELEAVVRLFLEHGQVVVAATCVHPARLAQFTEDFRRLLMASRVLELSARPRDVGGRGEGETEATKALQAELVALREARDGLERRLSQETNADCLARENAVSLEAEVTALREDRAALEKQLAESATLASEVASLNGRVAGLEAEATSLRNRLKRSESEAEGAFAEQARLQGQLGAYRHAEEQLAEERKTRGETDEALRSLRNGVAELLAWSDMEAAGLDPAAALSELLSGLEARRWLLVRHTAIEESARLRDEAIARAETAVREAEEMRRDHGARVGELEALVAQHEARSRAGAEEQGRLEQHLSDCQSRLATAEYELDKARRQVSLTAAEMDALRQEAATQVASASIQAGELQHRITTLEGALTLHHGVSQELADALARRAEDCARTAEALNGMAGRLGRLPDLPEAPRDAEPCENDQVALFDHEAFLSLPSSPAAELNEIAEAMSAMEPPNAPEEGPAEIHE